MISGVFALPENLDHAVALHDMHYNFCRIHQSLRFTPGMELSIIDHVWSLEGPISITHEACQDELYFFKFSKQRHFRRKRGF
jgi:hypothetical protein